MVERSSRRDNTFTGSRGGQCLIWSVVVLGLFRWFNYTESV